MELTERMAANEAPLVQDVQVLLLVEEFREPSQCHAS